MSLANRMGQLLGPRPVQESVITRYENDTINYQIEGMSGPVPPEDAYRLLSVVASQIAPHIISAPQEAPSTHE